MSCWGSCFTEHVEEEEEEEEVKTPEVVVEKDQPPSWQPGLSSPMVSRRCEGQSLPTRVTHVNLEVLMSGVVYLPGELSYSFKTVFPNLFIFFSPGILKIMDNLKVLFEIMDRLEAPHSNIFYSNSST